MLAYHSLTPREKYIYSILLEVRHDSIWGVAVERFRKEPTPSHLRQLIAELSEAASDNPESMAVVIGWELTEILLQSNVPAA